MIFSKMFTRYKNWKLSVCFSHVLHINIYLLTVAGEHAVMFTRGMFVAWGGIPRATHTVRVNITEYYPLLSVNKYFVTSRANCMIMKICAFGHSTNPLNKRLTYVCIQEHHFHKSRTISILAKICKP